MVQATRWRQDSTVLPTNPYQRIRFFSTFPSGQGDSAFGWSPVPLDNAFRFIGAAAGVIPASGLSGAGLGLSLDTGGLVRGAAAIGGIVLGVWLAKRNMGR